ncbi:MAG TPA: glycosyltransferase family 9 protein [Bryobacteraceae bacterium]|nr:glycosyltransferase family 9 protein [Bryobacteraceae bacterium]
MAYLLERLPSGSRIAVIRLRSLGDCVLTTPALALLKSHRPDLRISVVVEDRFRAIFENILGVDEILPPHSSALGAWHPRAVLNLHGGTRSMWLTATAGAAIKAGFAHHAYSFLYSDKIPRAQAILGEERPVHTAEHLASAMFWMGVPRTEIPRARLHAAAASSAGAYAVLHPFASHPDKTWPAERFLAVARHLSETGVEPVFIAGPADEIGAFKQFQVHHNVSLGALKSLMAGAQIFVGNDSGPAHIAAAFGIPSVVLFGPSDPVTWAPWKTEAKILTSPESIQRITMEEVIAAADALKVRA